MKERKIPDGFYWFICERADHDSIVERRSGQWWTVNEVGPIKIEELNRRGWEISDQVKPRKKT